MILLHGLEAWAVKKTTVSRGRNLFSELDFFLPDHENNNSHAPSKSGTCQHRLRHSISFIGRNWILFFTVNETNNYYGEKTLLKRDGPIINDGEMIRVAEMMESVAYQ